MTALGFQTPGLRTQNVQFSDNTTVTLRHSQGHRKWYEQVKFNEQSHHTSFDFYHSYGVRENGNLFFVCVALPDI